jgi:hypothetical protein
MDQLIPTLLGIVGALAPVAFAYWKQERLAQLPRQECVARQPEARAGRFVMDDAIVRGGRVYL